MVSIAPGHVSRWRGPCPQMSVGQASLVQAVGTSCGVIQMATVVLTKTLGEGQPRRDLEQGPPRQPFMGPVALSKLPWLSEPQFPYPEVGIKC